MIRVENLNKFFGDHHVLKDINLEIKEKEVVCVIGPSGSGKSTFLRCLNLLEEVSSGKVVVDGHDLTDPKTNINKVRMEVGMVFQQFELFPHKKVIENITLAPIHVRRPSPFRRSFPAVKNNGWPLLGHWRWNRS
jgi:polar amino acid transport system ATP-binding protein